MAKSKSVFIGILFLVLFRVFVGETAARDPQRAYNFIFLVCAALSVT